MANGIFFVKALRVPHRGQRWQCGSKKYRNALRKCLKTLINKGFSPFSRWHLFCQHVPKNPESIAFRIFSFVSAGHNIICVQRTQHHLCATHATSFSQRLTPFRRRRTQMNDVALRANDVLRNDVGLRPMMLRFAQTG